MKIFQKGLIAALAFSLILFPPSLSAAAWQQGTVPPPTEPSTAEELAYGVLSIVASTVYSPLKLTYATLGLIVGGLSFAVSIGNADVAQIIDPSVRGTYVLTSRHIRGEDPIIFFGPPPVTTAQPQDLPPPQPLSRR